MRPVGRGGSVVLRAGLIGPLFAIISFQLAWRDTTMRSVERLAPLIAAMAPFS